MTKRGVLIGCGFFAENHLHAWAALDGAEIVAICDLDAARLNAVGYRFGIALRYTDAAEMLADVQADFADIATTVATHQMLVELCAAHVSTVICQKPFAETIASGQAMVEACKAQDTQLIIHENFRWQRPFTTMKQLVRDGSIGTPNFARFAFRHGYDNYANQPYLAEIERFTIMDVGLHLFDLARHFLGEVAHLTCATQSLNPKVRGEDAFTALLQHQGGATCVCDCSFFAQYTPEPFPNTAAVIEGDGGTLELDRAFNLTLHQNGTQRSIDVEPPVPEWGDRPWHGVQHSVFAFQSHALKAMQGQVSAQPSGADNLNTLSLALAAYEAAATAATIDMNAWQETKT